MIVREASKVRNRQTTWYVQSETNPTLEYVIHHKRDLTSHRPKWTCNCLDFTERKTFTGDECKHIGAVHNFVAAKEFLATQVTQATQPAMTTKEMIQLIVAALSGPNGRALWDVISALRGPDSDDEQLKQETTATLRGALDMVSHYLAISHANPLGLVEYLSHRTSSPLMAGVALKVAIQNRFPGVQAHFLAHYCNALQALVKLGFLK